MGLWEFGTCACLHTPCLVVRIHGEISCLEREEYITWGGKKKRVGREGPDLWLSAAAIRQGIHGNIEHVHRVPLVCCTSYGVACCPPLFFLLSSSSSRDSVTWRIHGYLNRVWGGLPSCSAPAKLPPRSSSWSPRGSPFQRFVCIDIGPSFYFTFVQLSLLRPSLRIKGRKFIDETRKMNR